MSTLDVEELLTFGRLDIEQGRPEAGLLKFKQAIAAGDCPREAHVEIARLYAQLGLRKKAQLHFKRYLEQNPGDLDAKFQFGMVLFEDRQAEPALAIWNEVLKLSPRYPPALFYRALAAAQAAKTTDARQQLRSLMQAVPADNLYFARASELLKSLEDASGDKVENVKVLNAGAAYRTEH